MATDSTTVHVMCASQKFTYAIRNERRSKVPERNEDTCDIDMLRSSQLSSVDSQLYSCLNHSFKTTQHAPDKHYFHNHIMKIKKYEQVHMHPHNFNRHKTRRNSNCMCNIHQYIEQTKCR